MTRILDVDSSKGWGGQEIRTQRLINGLNRDEFTCFFAASKQSTLYKRRGSINATFIPLEIRSSLDLKAVYNLVKIVRRYDIDLIATHSGHDGWIGALVAKITSTPVVRTRHLQIPITSPLSYNLSTQIVVDSQQVKDLLISQKVQGDKITIIHPGVNTESFNPSRPTHLRQELYLSDDTFLIGCTAYMRKLKRHDILLKAFSKLLLTNPTQKMHLALIGDGPYKPSIIDTINELNLQKHVTLLGARDDLPLLLPDLDLFALASDKEAFGMALIEASASEVAVIGSDAGGIQECVTDGKTGFIFPRGNDEKLFTLMQKLLDDPSLRKKIALQGRKHVIDHFSLENMIQQTEKLYRNLTS